MSEANPVGRPSAYEERYCDELESFMAQGYSFAAFAGSIGVCRATLDNWAKEHPEFLGARNRAKAKRLMHWEKQGLKVAQDGGASGQATMIAFGLKNMSDGDWTDTQRQELSGPGGSPIQTRATVDVTGLTEEQLRVLASVPVHGG